MKKENVQDVKTYFAKTNPEILKGCISKQMEDEYEQEMKNFDKNIPDNLRRLMNEYHSYNI